MPPDVSSIIASYDGGGELEETLGRVKGHFEKQPYLPENTSRGQLLMGQDTVGGGRSRESSGL